MLRIVKNTAALFIGKASIVFFSFAFIVAAARFLGVADFGIFTLVRGYFELFLSLSAYALMNVMTRDIAREPEATDRYITAGLLVVSGTTLVSVVILLLIALFAPYAATTRIAIVLTCVALWPATLSMVYEAAFVAREKAEYVTIGTLLENALRTVLSFVVLLLGHGVLALVVVLIGARLAMLVAYALLAHRSVARIRWSFAATLDGALVRRLFHDWKVFALENSLANVYWNLSLIMLSLVRDEAAVGIYGAARRILSLFSMVADSYTLATYPALARLFAESAERFRRVSEVSLKYMLALALPGAAVAFFLADEVIALLYGSDYAAAAPVLAVLVWVMVIRFVNPYMSYLLFAQGRQQRSLHVMLISLVVYAPLSYVWVLSAGAVGAALAMLVAVVVSFCLYLWFVAGSVADALRVLGSLLRVLLAVAGTFVVLLLVQQYQPQPVPSPLLAGVVLLLVGTASYAALVVLLRVVSPDERAEVRVVAAPLLAKMGRFVPARWRARA